MGQKNTIRINNSESNPELVQETDIHIQKAQSPRDEPILKQNYRVISIDAEKACDQVNIHLRYKNTQQNRCGGNVTEHDKSYI